MMGDLYMESFSLDEFDDLWSLADLDGSIGESGQKRRRVEDNHHLLRPHRPRILKADFRRSFPQIWAGVFNSADHSTMMHHLCTFYDRDVSILQQDLRLGAITKGIKTKGPIQGQMNLGEFWYSAMKIAPDQVCTLKHTYVKLRSDGTSSITCTFGLTGTEIICVEEQTPEGNYHTSPVNIKQEGTDALQDVLQRYIKATEAVNRTKAQIKAEKAAKARARYAAVEGLDRRRRKHCEDFRPLPNVEEWLIDSTRACAQGDMLCNAKFESYARYPNVAVAMQRFHTDGFTLRDDNNHLIPQKPTFKYVEGGVLTAQLNLTCSIEMRFNVQCRVEAVVVTYLD